MTLSEKGILSLPNSLLAFHVTIGTRKRYRRRCTATFSWSFGYAGRTAPQRSARGVEPDLDCAYQHGPDARLRSEVPGILSLHTHPERSESGRYGQRRRRLGLTKTLGVRNEKRRSLPNSLLAFHVTIGTRKRYRRRCTATFSWSFGYAGRTAPQRSARGVEA